MLIPTASDVLCVTVDNIKANSIYTNISTQEIKKYKIVYSKLFNSLTSPDCTYKYLNPSSLKNIFPIKKLITDRHKLVTINITTPANIFESNIFHLLFGVNSKNFIVPFDISVDTAEPMIIIIKIERTSKQNIGAYVS